MNQFRTLSIGWDVHRESIAVAYVAKDPEADVIDLGTIGHDTSTSITSSAHGHRRLNTWSSSAKRGRVAPGATGIGAKQDTSAGSSPLRCSPTRRVTG
jgi:hypothetical protein